MISGSIFWPFLVWWRTLVLQLSLLGLGWARCWEQRCTALFRGWDWCPDSWGFWTSPKQIYVRIYIPNSWAMFNWDIYQPLLLLAASTTTTPPPTWAYSGASMDCLALVRCSICTSGSIHGSAWSAGDLAGSQWTMKDDAAFLELSFRLARWSLEVLGGGEVSQWTSGFRALRNLYVKLNLNFYFTVFSNTCIGYSAMQRLVQMTSKVLGWSCFTTNKFISFQKNLGSYKWVWFINPFTIVASPINPKHKPVKCVNLDMSRASPHIHLSRRNGYGIGFTLC